MEQGVGRVVRDAVKNNALLPCQVVESGRSLGERTPRRDATRRDHDCLALGCRERGRHGDGFSTGISAVCRAVYERRHGSQGCALHVERCVWREIGRGAEVGEVTKQRHGRELASTAVGTDPGCLEPEVVDPCQVFASIRLAEYPVPLHPPPQHSHLSQHLGLLPRFCRQTPNHLPSANLNLSPLTSSPRLNTQLHPLSDGTFLYLGQGARVCREGARISRRQGQGARGRQRRRHRVSTNITTDMQQAGELISASTPCRELDDEPKNSQSSCAFLAWVGQTPEADILIVQCSSHSSDSCE